MGFPLIIPALAMSAAKMGMGFFQNAKANKINPVYDYKKDKAVGQRLGLAQSLLNSQLPGMSGYQAGINAGMSTAVQNNNIAATNSASAMAGNLAAYQNMLGAQGSLRDKVADWRQNMIQNFNQATDASAQETARENSAMWQKYQADSQAKQQMRQSAWNNIFGGASDALGFGQLASMGMLGKLNKDHFSFK